MLSLKQYQSNFYNSLARISPWFEIFCSFSIDAKINVYQVFFTATIAEVLSRARTLKKDLFFLTNIRSGRNLINSLVARPSTRSNLKLHTKMLCKQLIHLWFFWFYLTIFVFTKHAFFILFYFNVAFCCGAVFLTHFYR